MSASRISPVVVCTFSLWLAASCSPPSMTPEDAGASPGDAGSVADAGHTVDAGAVCGNGQVEPGEACDFGGGNSDTIPNRCRTTCVAAACGDGVLDLGEACDDGSFNSDTLANACRSTCRAPSCGDGVVDLGEACDDGALNSDTLANACRTTCVAPACGDGVVDTAEACDDGANNSDTTPNACRSTCRMASCGDGVLDASEACDDGNATYGDGCASCATEATCVVTLGLQTTDPNDVRWALGNLSVDDATGTFVDGGLVDLGPADTSSLSLSRQAVAICGHDVYALANGGIAHSVIAPDGSLSAADSTAFPYALAIACPRGARTLHALRAEGSVVEYHAFPLAADGSLGQSEVVATSLPVLGSSPAVSLAPRSDGSAWVTSATFQTGSQGGYSFLAPADGGYAETFHAGAAYLLPVGVATTDDPFAALQVVVPDPTTNALSVCYSALSSTGSTLGAMTGTRVCTPNAAIGNLMFSPDGTRLLSAGTSLSGVSNAPGLSLTWTASGSLGTPMNDIPSTAAFGLAVSLDQRWIFSADTMGTLMLFGYLDPTFTLRDARSTFVLDVETAGCRP